MSGVELDLIRPELRGLKPYVSARSLTTRGEVFLDANEASESWSPGMNRYPEPQPAALLARFSRLYGVDSRSITIGRGSDEAIDLLVRLFCRPGVDQVLTCPPTYGMYEVAAGIQGCTLVQVPLLRPEPGQFKLDIEKIVALAPKLIFICSPNNPTGTAFDPLTIERICEGVRGRSIVVVDEAYVEFGNQVSLANRLEKFPNLVILRTLSKAWGLAGARCGVSLASPELTAELQKIRAPYPLSSPQLKIVLEALSAEHQNDMDSRVATVFSERQRMVEALSSLPGVVRVFPSSTNFLLVQFDDSARVMTRARDRGVILRDRNHESGLAGCIRITIGSAAENDLLLGLLA